MIKKNKIKIMKKKIKVKYLKEETFIKKEELNLMK